MTIDKRKQSLYFPEEMLDEIRQQASRLDRSLSWVVQQTWRHARKAIMSMPSSEEPERDDSMGADKRAGSR